MIVGVGVDLLSLERMQQVLERDEERWVRRILAPEERAVYERLSARRKLEYMGGRFAAKEAVAKALGCGIGGVVGWQDVAVISDGGPPEVRLSPEARQRLRERGVEVSRLHLSLSHDGPWLVAYAIAEK